MYKTIISLTLFLIFFVINANAQVKEFKIIYGQKELIFHNFDTLDAKIFEVDTIRIIPNLFNPMNKYSFEGGKLMIKTIGNKAGTKNDTVYYFAKFQPILQNNELLFMKVLKATEITIFTILKTIIANYKEEFKEYTLYFYLK
jgi:hypothetical protein